MVELFVLFSLCLLGQADGALNILKFGLMESRSSVRAFRLSWMLLMTWRICLVLADRVVGIIVDGFLVVINWSWTTGIIVRNDSRGRNEVVTVKFVWLGV